MLPRSVTLHNSQLSLASMVARPFTPSVQDGHIGDALLRGSESVWGHGLQGRLYPPSCRDSRLLKTLVRQRNGLKAAASAPDTSASTQRTALSNVRLPPI